jgi:aminoglycoside 2'-N-acetyltransferase I
VQPDQVTTAFPATLCDSCSEMRAVLTPKGSRFLLCRLSATDSAFPKYPRQPVLNCPGYRPTSEIGWQLRSATDVGPQELTAVRALADAVYPPEVKAVWPGRAIEWAAHQWGIVGLDAAGSARCYVGLVIQTARLADRPVKVGGIGGVKTHPASRGRGLATAAVRRAIDFFHEHVVDFGLLVCEPDLVPFYERLGWQRFRGDLLVKQRGTTVPFTFNLAMTIPVRFLEAVTGTIDLMGPPW